MGGFQGMLPQDIFKIKATKLARIVSKGIFLLLEVLYEHITLFDTQLHHNILAKLRIHGVKMGGWNIVWETDPFQSNRNV